MENKKNIKIFSIIVILSIVFIGLFLSFYIYGYLTESLILENVKKESIGIEIELYQEVKDTPPYGTSVTTEEPGFGRDNPFLPNKELPSEIVTDDQNDTAVNEAINEVQSD